MIVLMSKKYVGNRDALQLVMLQKRKMFVTKINIAILTMEFAIVFANPQTNVQEVILAIIPSVIKIVMILMIVAGTNFVMSNN